MGSELSTNCPVGGIFRSSFRACLYRKDLKNPPTAVGGIFWTFEAKVS